jgi:hypothetical protein
MGRVADAERALYEDVWSLPEYRKWSPGVEAIPRFLRLTGAQPNGARVIDFGCGSGAASLALRDLGFDPCMIDQTDAGLLPEARTIPYRLQSLWQPVPEEIEAALGFSCDVLEHIPTEFTALTIATMADAVGTLYLEISTEPDGCGVLVGQTLHKTVQPFSWWLALCREIGTVTQAVDLLHRAAFVVIR